MDSFDFAFALGTPMYTTIVSELEAIVSELEAAAVGDARVPAAEVIAARDARVVEAQVRQGGEPAEL